ncbi:MAG: hypothetical protein ABII82_07715 [Verrucomicrobiota bacterium]
MFAVLALAVVAAGALIAWRGLRRRICLRRADCCGKGCGCVFPRKAK